MKLPRLTSTKNRDGSETLYVNGKKDMRGTTLEVCVRIEELTQGREYQIAARAERHGLTVASWELFVDLANDAGNWSGQPMLNGNVRTDKALAGNITDLKKKGLITTEVDEGQTWVQFTDAGVALAATFGVII